MERKKMDKKRILHLINKTLGYQFNSTYSWSNMIDDIEELSPEEKEWAKENTGYKTYICG